MLKLLRCYLFILLLPAFGSAKAQRLPLDTYHPGNGLVDTRLIKMFQDSRGRIYFLSRDGFSVFDGQRFESYTRIGNTEVGMCNDIVEHPNGTIGIYNFGGLIFNCSDKGIRIDSAYKKQLSEFTRILPLGNGEHIVSTNYHLFLEKNNRFSQLNISLPGAPFLYSDQLAVFKQYVVFNKWADSDNRKFFLYDFRKQQYKDFLRIPAPGRMVVHPNGSIFIYDREWMQLDTNALQQGRFKTTKPGFHQWMPKNFPANNLFFDHNNDIWLINGEKGCCRINHQTGEPTYYLISDGLLNGINSIFQDAEQNIWFIAPGRGVQKLHQSPLSAINTINGQTPGYITGVYALPGNRYAVHANGIVYAGKERFPVSDNRYCFYWRGGVWQAAEGTLYNAATGATIPLEKEPEFVPPYNTQYSGQYTEDKEGRLLISGGLLIAIDPTYRVAVKKLPYFADNVVVDAENKYWCFMRNNEVAVLQWQNGVLNITASYPAPSLNPRFTLLWEPGVFVVGTRHRGVRFISLVNGQLVETGGVGQEQGLSNNFVYALVRRGEHELVAGTANGLDIIQFNQQDTLVKRIAAGSNLFSGFTSLATAPGGMVVGRSEDGLIYQLENSGWKPSGFTPKLTFKAVYVNGEEKNIHTQHRFAYTRNNFRFSVSCPSFLDNKNIQFHFLLKGRGRNWQQQALLPDFEINNLEPGRYTLYATVQYPGRVYPDETISYTFTILPPVWKRWWFIAGLALLLTSVIAYIIRAYLRRKLEKQKAAFEQQRAIELERTRIATDMHDDFGAGLSRIKFISEKMLLRHKGNEALQPELEKISGYSDEMAEKMGEIIWALNQKYDTYDDTVAFCRYYASEYLEGYNMAMQFDAAPADVQLKGEVRRNIFLVMKEALHNTIKHAGANKVVIRFHIADKQLLLHIHDNGKGMDERYTRPFSNGLYNMRKRVTEIGGTILFSNDPGLAIDIEIPL
ncbi:MAG: hypothetical protein JNM68_05030 [Dinghuibacter sp.]|nr:hypothetical protein [Dinghuibacter sp.]